MAPQHDPHASEQTSEVEREDPALQLSGGGANPLQIAVTFALAAAIVGLVLYGINNQYPVGGADPSTVASAPGAAPATPQATGGQAADDAPTQPSANEGKASPQPGRDPAAPQPERGTADRGQPGQATGNDGAGGTPAERQSGGKQRLKQ